MHNYLGQHTVAISVPVSLVASVLFFALGYPDMACGVLIGAAAGMLKSYLLGRQVVTGQRSLALFFLRYGVVALAFVLGIMLSLKAFFAAVAGLFFVHVVFIMDQVRTDSTEEIGKWKV